MSSAASLTLPEVIDTKADIVCEKVIPVVRKWMEDSCPFRVVVSQLGQKLVLGFCEVSDDKKSEVDRFVFTLWEPLQSLYDEHESCLGTMRLQKRIEKDTDRVWMFY